MALDLIIRANRFAPMLAFYRDQLGFRPLEEQTDPMIYTPGRDWIALDTGSARVELFARRTPQPRPTASPPSVVPAIRVTDIEELVSRLRADRVRIVREGSQAWGRYADLLDPEGNEIDLYEDLR